MGQVNIAHVDECQTGAFPELTGLTALGEIGSRGVYAKPDRPLWLWMHELASGAQIRFAQPPLAHLLYVWKGELAADGVSVGAEGVVCVEHLGTTTVTAGQSGATLLHYHSQGPDPTREARPGGGVHVLGCDGIRKVRDDTYYETTTTESDDSGNCGLNDGEKCGGYTRTIHTQSVCSSWYWNHVDGRVTIEGAKPMVGADGSATCQNWRHTTVISEVWNRWPVVRHDGGAKGCEKASKARGSPCGGITGEDDYGDDGDDGEDDWWDY